MNCAALLEGVIAGQVAAIVSGLTHFLDRDISPRQV